MGQNVNRITFRGTSPHFKYRPFQSVVEPFAQKKVNRLWELDSLIRNARRAVKNQKIGSPEYYFFKKEYNTYCAERTAISNSSSIKRLRNELKNKKIDPETGRIIQTKRPY